jgi:hypothetical protein
MQVSECYIRVRYPPLSKLEFDGLSERLFRVAIDIAQVVGHGREIDFTLEEGTLWQRILVNGALLLGIYSGVAQYHEFRESVIQMVRDGHAFSSYERNRLHELTDTKPTDAVYKRTVSRDVNRLRRIISAFDHVTEGRAPVTKLPSIRRQVIHDLAALARANPNDPEIADFIRSLTKDPIPDLPDAPRAAIYMDDQERRRGLSYPADFRLEGQVVHPRPTRRRRRFHKQANINR